MVWTNLFCFIFPTVLFSKIQYDGYDYRFENTTDLDRNKLAIIKINIVKKMYLNKLLDNSTSINDKKCMIDECISKSIIDNPNQLYSDDITAGNLFKDFDFNVEPDFPDNEQILKII